MSPRAREILRRSQPGGFTLVELIMGMTITSILTMVLAGMILAAGTAWDHTTGQEDAMQQARSSIDRIQYMVSQAGTYKIAGQSTVPGIAVVERVNGSTRLPEVLVVWSGGTNGGMVANGLMTRLPLVQELVIYAPRYDDPSTLVEITSPADASSIDFKSAAFSNTILTIIASNNSSKLRLSNRVHINTLSFMVGNSTSAGAVRFEMYLTPTDSELSGVVTGSAQWYSLVWAQGVASSASGMRQAGIRMEFQLEAHSASVSGSSPANAAMPFFGSASYTYVYQP